MSALDSRSPAREDPEAPRTAAGRTRAPVQRARAAAGAVLVAVGVAFAVEAVRLGVGTVTRPSPGLFPLLIGILLAGSAVALLVQSLLGRGAAASDAAPADPEDPEPEGGGRKGADPRVRLAALPLLLVAYVVGAGWVGHLVTASLVTALSLKVTGGRSWWVCLAVGAAAGAGSTLLFAELLGVPLPVGLYGPEF